MDDARQALKINQSLLDLYSDTDFSALPNPSQGPEVLRQVRIRVTELENQVRMEAVEAEKKKLQEAKEKSASQEMKDPASDQMPDSNDDSDEDKDGD